MRNQIALGSAERAARRQAAVVRLELKRGLPWLAAAPLTAIGLGALGTAVMLQNVLRGAALPFPGCVAGGLSEAFVPLALGLAVAGPPWLGQRFLRGQADNLIAEMEIVCREIGLTLSPPVRRAPRLSAIDMAERAAMRQAAECHREHRRGLHWLAAAPVTILWGGFLLCARGILGLFGGSHCPITLSEDLILMADTLAAASLWLLAGLTLAIFVWLGHRYLLGQAGVLDDEMALASRDLAIALHRSH